MAHKPFESNYIHIQFMFLKNSSNYKICKVLQLSKVENLRALKTSKLANNF